MERLLIWVLGLVLLGAGVVFLVSMREDEVAPPPVVQDQDLPTVQAPALVQDTKPLQELMQQTGDGAPVPAQAGYFGEVRGKVTDLQGKPLSDVSITLFSYSYVQPPLIGRVRPEHEELLRAKTKTDGEGRYLFSDLGDVTAPYLSLRFELEGYAELLKDAIGPGMVIDASLEPGTPLSIRVIDEATKKPISGVLADLSMKIPGRTKHEYRRWRRKFRSDNNGLIEVPGAPSEKLTVFLEHPDYEWFFRKPEDNIWVGGGDENQFVFEMKAGVHLDGLVVDARTKEPIRDCLVTLREIIIPTRREKTGVFGKFSMSGLNRGFFEINFEAEGYSKRQERLEISDSAMKSQRVFEMVPAGMASGTVVDGAGNPVPGAEIYVAESRDIFRTVRADVEATTDREGVFSVRNLDDGRTYRIVAKAPEMAISVSADFVATSGEFFDGVIIQLGRGATIQGLVSDDAGSPLSGVSVTLEQPPYAGAWFPPGHKLGQKSTLSVLTDEKGYWKFSGLWSGPYQVTADHPEFIVMLPEELRISEGNETIEKNIQLLPGHVITGQVLNADGQAAAGATVTGSLGFYQDRVYRTTTDKDGNYRLTRLLDRSYRMKAWNNEGVAREVYDIPVDSSPVNFQLDSYGAIEGAVMTTEGSQPLDRFTVKIMPLMALEGRPETAVRQNDSRLNEKLMTSHEAYAETVIVNPDGRFAISNVHPGTYNVEVSADNRVEMQIPNVVVPPGGVSRTLAFLLRSGASLQGRIVDSVGQPINPTELRIRLAAARNATLESTTDANGEPVLQKGRKPWAARDVELNADGRFHIGGLPAGVLQVQMSSPKYCVPDWEEITFGKEGTLERNYSLIRAAKVNFRVRDQFGDLIKFPNAKVYDSMGEQARVDGRVVAARGDINGTVDIQKLKPGSYSIEFEVFSYAVTRVSIEVKEGEEVFQDIEMEKLVR